MKMDSTHASAALAMSVGIGLGVAIGWLLRGRLGSNLKKKMASKFIQEEVDSANNSGEIKLVLVVRNDLKMSKGKVAAQCSHAAVAACEKLMNQNPKLLQAWKYCGQPKVVVKTETEESIFQMSREAAKIGLNASLISDAGRTQIAPGSKTVLGVGPGPSDLVDQVTGHLKLF